MPAVMKALLSLTLTLQRHRKASADLGMLRVGSRAPLVSCGRRFIVPACYTVGRRWAMANDDRFAALDLKIGLRRIS
jgi:hypothetical protein